LGYSRFARHYSGNRCFFLFLRLLRCFSSPAYLHPPYVFRWGYPRITTGGFPHSEILGSKLGQQLPGAYRSRPRPSSAPGAKASTVCPCSLDSIENTTNRSGVFKVRAGTMPAVREKRIRPPGGRPCGLSKLSSLAGPGPERRCRRRFQASPSLDGTNAIQQYGRPRWLEPPHP
jgi:hypothetical protein